jgi:membrane-associated phospholipid phosphatase
MKIAAPATVERASGAQSPRPAWPRSALWVALWLGAIAVASGLDVPLASRVYSSGVYQTVKYSLLFRAIKAPGNVWAVPFLVLLVWWLSRPSVAPAILVGATAAIAGLFSTVVKWSVGRGRPIAHGLYNHFPFQPHFFRNGLDGLFAPQHNLSFPSGHTCLAFAIAGALGFLLPRYAAWFFVLAALVGAERLLEGAHYLSDVLAGGGLGVIAAIVAAWLYGRIAGSRGATSEE